jgi:ribosomal 50S subunit-associated protein YjgA (DUF615 family)
VLYALPVVGKSAQKAEESSRACLHGLEKLRVRLLDRHDGEVTAN